MSVVEGWWGGGRWWVWERVTGRLGWGGDVVYEVVSLIFEG